MNGRVEQVFPARDGSLESATLVATLTEIAAACTGEAIAAALLDGVMRLGAVGCALLSVHENDLVLRCVRGYGAEEQQRLAALSIESSDHPSAQCARTQHIVWRAARAAERTSQQTEVALPLMVHSLVVEVLCVSFAEGQSAARAHEPLLSGLAGACAAALDRARRYELLQARVREEEHLLGMASHDLRSPLQLITMASEVLAVQATLSSEQRKMLAAIGESSVRAAAMVSQLLDVTKVQLSGLTLSPEREDLFALLQRCVEDFRVRVPDGPISLVVSGKGEARVDRDRVIQVFHNLVSNALQYREPGSTVEIRAEGLSERVYVEVMNRGAAIDDERLASLFSPMKRGEQGGEQGNLGLGLFIVKRLVEAHGGRVWARSDESEGTTFVVELPREPSLEQVRLIDEALAPAAPRPPSDLPVEYATLHRALADLPLRTLLEHWLELGGATQLPHPRRFERARFAAWLPDMFTVEVLPGEGVYTRFRFQTVGGALERRLDGGPLRALVASAADDSLGASMFAAYERCVSTRRPVYDYLRTGKSRARSESFDRLVLPFSRDGAQVTHLVGIARFGGLPETSRRETMGRVQP